MAAATTPYQTPDFGLVSFVLSNLLPKQEAKELSKEAPQTLLQLHLAEQEEEQEHEQEQGARRQQERGGGRHRMG